MAVSTQVPMAGSKSQTYLAQGNAAMRAGKYAEAIKLFRSAQDQLPAFARIIKFNIALAEARLKGVSLSSLPIERDEPRMQAPVAALKRKLPLTALVITWDVGHNPLGRSYMLAEALDRVVQNVVLTGFQFERYGKSIWEPVRDGQLPVIPLKGEIFPELSVQFDKIIQKFKPDIVFACKPRLPSIQLGAMFKERYGIPLVIDIDDHELSFIKNRAELTVDNLLKLDKELVAKEQEPYSELWTRLTNDLVKYADAKIVSNIALQREFGGEIVPHVRDESRFDPSLYNKEEQREKYGIPKNAKVVMFFGTPRHHKGVGVLAEAVGQIKDPNFILVVVGTAPDKSVTSKLAELSKGKLINLPNQPFSAIPEIIVMADVICLPQDEGHETSKYQLPAKAIDAVAMGIPLLVSNTEPLMQLVKDNVAELVGVKNLHLILEQHVNSVRSSADIISRRNTFLAKYSYAAAGEQLRSIIEKVTTKNTVLKSCTDLNKLIDFQREAFNVRQPITKLHGKDIVVFWKQNDTGLYGRRHDMVIKYLASRDDVRKVIVVDAPISEFDLLKKRNGHGLTQDRSIYIKTYEKLLNQLDTDKVSYNVFAHKAGVYTYGKPEQGRKPIFEGYSNYLQNLFEYHGIKPSEAVFWFYPKNYLSSDIIEFFNPEKVVVDVVDDHRAWPGVTEAEKLKLTAHYKDILSKADLSFANCVPVIESMKTFAPNIKLVPNGCEEKPDIIEPLSNPLYMELKSFSGKIIGFVGNLESKIDIPLIEKIATTFPDALIVLVGSTHANPKVRELSNYSNVRMFGVVEYRYVNSIVRLFSVGIIPHLKTDMTKNMNPLKVFVYASNRIPIVSTEVENIYGADFIFKAGSHEAFISLISDVVFDKLICSDAGFVSFSNENSWASRFSKEIKSIF